jgi:spermidine synthase
MKPFETLDTFVTPAGLKLTLHRRDNDHFIYLDGYELMSTRVHDSETALGTLACEKLRGKRQARVLIGGLGMGFTLKAALEVLGPDAEVVQAEVFPVVVEWHRLHLQELAVPLDDARVRIHIGDVSDLIRSRSGPTYDAILLDTDNGPDAMCVGTNATLYDSLGIELARSALRPGGTLAVWSAHDDPAFAKRLRRCGFDVRTEAVRGHAGKGPRHFLFLAGL